MPVPEALGRNLRIPVIAAPMFLVSGVELVVAACRAGVIGTLPVLNARTTELAGAWLQEIAATVDPGADASWGVNLVVHRSNARLDADLAVIRQCRVPLVITSIGNPGSIVAAVHDYGGLVFHDVTTLQHARKAIQAGVDGLVLVCGGAGGNAGTVNPFAFTAELRSFWDGCLVLSGAITNGRAVRAAEVMGADLAYMGTRFIATDESLAKPAYKQMLVESQAADILYTNAFSGIRGSVLRASIVAAGHDPDTLPERTTIDLAAHLDVDRRSRSDIWSAGHGVGDVADILPVASLVDRLEAQYRAAHALP